MKPRPVRGFSPWIAMRKRRQAVTMCTSHPPTRSRGNSSGLGLLLSRSRHGRLGRRFRIAIQGENPRTGRGFIWHMFHARPGGGASPAATAGRRSAEWHTVGGLKIRAASRCGSALPLHFRLHEFLADPAGDGAHPSIAGGLLPPRPVMETAQARASATPHGRWHPLRRLRHAGGRKDARATSLSAAQRRPPPRVLHTRRPASRSGRAIALRCARRWWRMGPPAKRTQDRARA